MRKIFLGLVIALVLIMTGIKDASGAWLAGYSYRKKVTVTGQTGAGINYQVPFEIGASAGGNFHLEGHCTDFPNDIRFTDNDEQTQLHYWIEDITADPITVWVKVTDDLGSNVDIYCYYGKSGASNVSNGGNTFEFFDDFEDDPSITKSNYANGANNNYLQYDSVNKRVNYKAKRETNSGSQYGAFPYWINIADFIAGHFAIEVKHKVTARSWGQYATTWYFRFTESQPSDSQSDGDDSYAGFYGAFDTRHVTPGAVRGICYNKATETSHGTDYIQNLAYNTLYDLKLFKSASQLVLKIYDGDILKGSVSVDISDWSKTWSYLLYMSGGGGVATTPYEQGYFDDLIVRKYNDPEPAYSSTGSEETPVAPTVTTQAASSIEATVATGNGNITADGGASITQHGVCWSTSATPTITEDFTTYTEVDLNTYLDIDANTVTFTGLTRNEDAWVVKDKTAGHFDGDFEHLVTIDITSEDNGYTPLWMISNAIDDAYSDTQHLKLFWYDVDHKLYLQQYDGASTPYDSSIALTAGTIYYLKIKRDESVGTYGTLYCYIYDDASRTNLIDTLTVTLLVVKRDFRYIYGLNTYNGGVSSATSGYVENLDLQESNTKEGATTTGPFTSNMTGLSAGTLYHYRAYATNSAGTSYGADTTFTTVEAPTVTVSAATLVEETIARINGNVTATGGADPEVTMYWGTSDGGQTPGSWTNNSAPTSPSQPQGVAAFYKDVTGLSPGTLYYFSAKATNSGGTDWPAASLSFTTKPNPPTSPTSSSVEETTATLGWTAPASGSVDGYYCRYKTVSYPTSYTDGSEGSVVGTGSDLTGLTPGTKYYSRIWSYKTDSPNTGGVCDTPIEGTFTTKPNAPTNPASFSVEDTTASLSWDAPASGSVDGYYCRYKTGSYPTSYTDGSEGSVSGTGSDLTGLSQGTEYYYRIWSYKTDSPNGGGCCDTPIGGTFTTKPAAPTNVAATDGDHTDKVVITWTKSTGATDYHVWRDAVDLGAAGDVATFNDSGADAPIITPGTGAASDGTSSAHVALSLSGESANNGTTHTYKVVASNATGNSADSSTNTGYRGVGSLTYQWQRSAADSNDTYSDIGGATASTYNDTGAPADGSGRYYKCVEDATDAAQQISAVDRGYRMAGPTVEYEIARDVDNFEIKYYNSSMEELTTPLSSPGDVKFITIEMTVIKNGISVPLRSTVYPRNF